MLVSLGVQSYVKPSGKTNRKLIINAVTHVCLPGVVNKETKEKCLQVCKKLAKISGMFQRVRLATLRVFQQFRQKSQQLIVEYYLHWTTTFEISFSGSSDTNHDSLL